MRKRYVLWSPAEPAGGAGEGAGAGQGEGGQGAGQGGQQQDAGGQGGGEHLDAAALAAQQAVADANKSWYAALPESTHEALKGFETPEAAMEAAVRGKDYKPAKEVSEYTINFANQDPANAEASKEIGSKFAQFCFEKGIPPQVAQDLVTWQEDLAADANKAVVEAGTEELRKKWGPKYDQNRQGALVAITMLDKHMDGRLAPAMERLGLANDPVVVEALHLISTTISEDSLGATGAGGGNIDREEDPVTSYKKMGFS